MIQAQRTGQCKHVFASFSNDNYFVIDSLHYKEGMHRTNIFEEVKAKRDNPESVKAAVVAAEKRARVHGMDSAGMCTQPTDPNDIFLIAVRADHFRSYQPQLFAEKTATDEEILRVYTEMQQTDNKSDLTPDEIKRAKVLWSQSVIKMSKKG